MLTNTAPLTIAVLVGSTRPGSVNQVLADQLADLVPHGVTMVAGLDQLPWFAQELEGEVPAVVADVREQVATADALVVVTPEYNGAMPGMLKNAIDWLSRPRQSSALEAKPVAVIGASPAPGGAEQARLGAQAILRRALAAPIEATFGWGQASDELSDEQRSELAAVLDELVTAAQSAREQAA